MTTRAPRYLVLAWAGLSPLAATAHAHTRAEPAPAASPHDATQAKAALARAREAARAGDYGRAIEHYEHALSLQPAAKLHFNIAVCHHRLLGEQEAGSAPYQRHRAAAVEAYNRYLQADPGADDREQVAALVRALGGTPITDHPEPWTIELVEPDDVPEAPGFDEPWDREPDAPAPTIDPEADPDPDGGDAESDASAGAPAPKHPRSTDTGPVDARGRLGPFIPLVQTNPRQLAASDELRAVPSLGLGVRGSAFLGARRRVTLGGELALVTQLTSSKPRYRVNTSYLGLALGYRHPLGHGRFELGVDGVIGLGSQGLVHDGDHRLRCTKDREASRRNGLWAGSRMVFAVLLGRHRNHEISARVGPGLALFAEASRVDHDPQGNPCEGEPTAFETFGLPEGAALVVSFDLGYAPRF